MESFQTYLKWALEALKRDASPAEMRSRTERLLAEAEHEAGDGRVWVFVLPPPARMLVTGPEGSHTYDEAVAARPCYMLRCRPEHVRPFRLLLASACERLPLGLALPLLCRAEVFPEMEMGQGSAALLWGGQ